MEFNKTVRIDLTEAEITSIIAEYMSKKVNRQVHPENITYDVRSKIEGYGLGEFTVEYLHGCSVVYQEK